MEYMEEKEKTKEQLIDELMKLHRQITELEKSEIRHQQIGKASTDNEEKYRILAELAADGILIETVEGRILECNTAGAKIYGYAKEEMIGLTIADLVPEEFAIQLPKVITDKETTHGIFVPRISKKKDGTIFPTEIATKIVSIGGKPRLIAYVRDITKPKEAEKKLRKARKIFASLFNSSPIAALYHDEDGRILNINPYFTKTFGYTLKEIRGRNIDEGMIYPENKIDEGERLTKKGLTFKGISEYETIRKKKDGTLIYVVISASPVIIDGQSEGTIVLYRDITERKKAEEALLKSQQEFVSLFMNSPEALVYQDEKGNIIDINPRFTELFGYTLDEIKGRNTDDGMIHPPNKIEEGKDLVKMALSKGYLNYETIRKKKDGTLFPVSISGSRVMLDGKLQGAIGMYRDITERKQDEQLQQVLYNISKAANSAISLDQLYPLIHQELGSIIDTTNFYIALIDEKEDKIYFPYHVDEKDDNFPIINFSTANTLTAYVIKNGQPLLNDNNQYKEMVNQGILSPWGSTTPQSIWLGVPLKIEDKTIGVMAVQSYTNPHLYSEKDIKLLEFVSSQVATAIERKKTEEKIRYLSFHDALTDLYNRAYFEEELERYNFPRYCPLSIMMVDINGLKVINDTFGHHEGDKLLQHFASLLNYISRKGDIIARLGGDEFAILLPSTTSQETHRICERIRKICEEDKTEPVYLRPSISLGYATQEGEYQNTEALLKEADKRMYQDKLFQAKSREKYLLDSF